MNSTVRYLRAVLRALAFCMVTVFFYGMWLNLVPFLLFLDKASYRWRSFNFRNWARATAALLRMRIAVEGTQPQEPFFAVSNHLSYLDVVTLASQLDCVFIAKSDVAGWPVLGLLCRSMGTIFVNRNSRKDVLRVNALIETALDAGKGVLLFPEGTSTAGVEVLPFHSALLEPAARAGYPVSYATINYRTPAGEPPANLSVCWWGEMTFLSHLWRLFQLASFDATVAFGSHSIRADDRKTLARELWHAVQQEFVPSAKTEDLCKLVIH
jgi:1-acyl-sn-glycerol-3-phosphate acyltransferase